MDKTATLHKLALNQRVVIAKNLLRAAASETESKMRSLSLRLAARVLKASIQTDMDIMARLQILEGVSQIVPPGPRAYGPWSKNPRRGLALAAAHFAGDSVDPEWFSPTDTRLLRMIESKLTLELKKFSRGQENAIRAEDFIQNALAGLNVDGTPSAKGPMFYQIGAFNSEFRKQIPLGTLPPMKAYPISVHFLTRKVIDYFKVKDQTSRSRNHLTDSSSGEEESVFDRRSKDKPDDMTILKDVLQEKDSKAAKMLFDFFESNLRSGKETEISLAVLRNHLTGGGLTQGEIAEQFGVTKAFISNLLSLKIKPLIQKLRKTDILDRIYDLVELESLRRYAKRNR